MTDEAQKPEQPAKNPNLSSPPKRADFEMNTNPQDSSKVMLIGMGVIAAVALIGGVIAVTPQVKNIGAQKEKIADLEAQLAASKAKEQSSANIETQLSDMQLKMQALTEQAKQVQSSVVSGDMQGKFTELETKFNQVLEQSHAMGLAGMMARIQALQQSPEGSSAISSIVSMLASSPEGSDVGQNFEAMRSSNPAVAQITEGVAPEDMKAAAMLMAMSQMRHSLQRSNDSFDEDLALLKRTIPSDDPALMAAIDRLAPQAKYGVLTPDGLSKEFRGLTGDIVSASLSGKDVSLKEKAKARMADVFLVEKNGQRVSGTEEQIAVAAAQKQLDAGNVEGALEILKTLKGPAAQESQPFIEKAEATLMAGNLQNVISQNAIQSVKSSVQTMVNGGLPNGIVNPYGASSITNQLKSLVPGAPTPLAPSVTAPR